jgi:hypothetical protein
MLFQEGRSIIKFRKKVHRVHQSSSNYYYFWYIRLELRCTAIDECGNQGFQMFHQLEVHQFITIFGTNWNSVVLQLISVISRDTSTRQNGQEN